MIQHIKFNRSLFFYFFIFLLFSCKNEKISSDNEEQATSTSINSTGNESEFKKDKIGIWKIVASSKLGGWTKGEEFTYTKEQLSDNYINSVIVFTEYDITIDKIKPDYICGSNFELSKETLDFNLNGTDKDRENVKLFLKKEFNLLESNFKGVYNTNCETPFHTIFDFGDKLLIREWGTYYYLFEKQEGVKQVKFEGYNCKESENQNIYEQPLYKICECDYDFSKCYSIFYEESSQYYQKMLLKNLPEKDVKPSSGFAGTYYKFHKKDSLEIIIQEDGAASSYLFRKVNGKTIIEHYADAP